MIHVASDSQNQGYEAYKAFDGDPKTFWHSEFSHAPFEATAIAINCGYDCGCNREHPHLVRSRRYQTDRPFELRVDLGDVYELTGFRYLPRHDDSDNGKVAEFKAFALLDAPEAQSNDVDEALCAPSFAEDGLWHASYGDATVAGDLSDYSDSTVPGEVLFDKPVKARYFVFQVINAIQSQPFGSVAELELLSPGRVFLAKKSVDSLARSVDVKDGVAWASELTGVESNAVESSVYFNDLVDQYNRLVEELSRLDYYQAISDQLATSEASLSCDDRDPTDVVFRRVVALWRRVRESESLDNHQGESELFESLVEAVKSVEVCDYATRFKLYLCLTFIRRSLLMEREELDFNEILFVKRHRSNYSHICDQFYGRSAAPGGGLFVLSQPWGDSKELDVDALKNLTTRALNPVNSANDSFTDIWNVLYHPSARDLLADSTVENQSRLHGQKLQGGAFLAPELSFDAKKIAFAWCECVGSPEHIYSLDLSQGHTVPTRCWHIFTCNVDGSGLEQITDGSWNDIDPCFLPNGRIAFITERRGGYLRCGRDCPNYTLFDMNPDGSKIRALSVHETNEWAPSVSNEGQILWTRWDYIDRFGCIVHGAWTTSPDGRNPRAVCGNYAPRHLRPDSVLDIRAIPDSNKLIATAGPHHGQSFGSIIEIDPNAPDDPKSPVIRMTPDVGFPESQNGAQVWGTPWPLAEDLFLAVADYDMGENDGREGGRYKRGAYGVYLSDAFGNRELIYRDPEIGASTPIPLVERAVPPIVPSLNDVETLEDKPYFEPLPFDAPRPQGIVAIQNVYEADQPVTPGTKIAAIRVVQVLCMSVPSGNPPYEIGVREATATDSVKLARRVWGTAPVEEDGSACFYAPADCEIYFQTLDENGVALQSMRSGTALRPGERLGCVGCHEARETTISTNNASQIDNQNGMSSPQIPLAFRREPSRLISEGAGTEPVNFPELIQPILDAKCVTCHSQPDSQAQQAPDLSRNLEHGFYASYWNLVQRGYGFTDFGDPLRTPTENFGMRASKWHELMQEHYGVELSSEEWRRIALWLDTTGNFYGVYDKEGCEKQLRAERAVPTLE
ncbi:MAG: hypothetical protein Q4G03_05760 [Planctomycetia bacterium]|nr:hypothetical protein [Planctomycetia bacterium]